MAKFKFTDVPPIGVVFDGPLELEVDSDRERAVYTDTTTGSKLILIGENLKESASEEGHFTAGTVEKMMFKNGDGELMIQVTDGNFKAKHFNDDFDANGAWGIFDSLFGGNDRIEGGSYSEPIRGEDGDDRLIGGKGEDTIYGGAGDDVMTGGKDTDYFYFEKNGVEHDRITDLDIKGNDMDVLGVAWEIEKFGKANHGKDTLLTFENGATLEIDNVTRADFIDYWNANGGMD